MKTRASIAALLVVLSIAALGSQRAEPPDPQTPTFRVDVEYVEVDAVVTDGSGQFVRDLTQDDFQIFEDGRPQQIAAFSLVDIPLERPVAPTAAGPVEADTRSNEEPFDGRVYVMVVDDLHTSLARTIRVREAARRFIQQYLGANDLMAVVHTAGPSDANQDLTANKRLLSAAVDRTLGRRVASASATRPQGITRATGPGAGDPVDLTDPMEAERQSNARRSLETLQDVARWFADLRGRRKAILFLSEGFEYDFTGFDRSGGPVLMQSMRETLATAARGNVSIYAIDPRGLSSLIDRGIEAGGIAGGPDLGPGAASLRRELTLSQGSLRELSQVTGGFAAVNANDFDTAFERIVRDNSSYYALAYYPPESRAGEFHRIDVRVRRAGLDVRARRGYVTRDPAEESGRGGDPPGGPARLMTPEIRQALDSPLPQSGLGLRVFAAPFKGTAPNASILLGVELRGRDLRMEDSDRVAVTYAAIDAEGQVRAGSTDSISMALRPDVKRRVADTGLRLLNRLDLPPGRYQLRVAAHDRGGGVVGSVHYDLEVPDFADQPLSMSGVVITSAAALGQPTARPDEPLRQVLPGPPVGTRTFPQNDEIAVHAEVYDNDASTPHKVEITTTLAGIDGRAVFEAAEVRDSSELQGRPGGYGHTTRLRLSDLPPGSYVLTISARAQRGDARPIERQVPFVVTEPLMVPSR
jgi:VWFA-related protein